MFFDFFKSDKQIIYDSSNKLLSIPVTGCEFSSKRFESDPVTVDKKTFDILYREFTYGLMDHIPKQYDNFIHSGGSLHDILTNNFVSTVQLGGTHLPFFSYEIIKEYADEYTNIDIDIFVYGCDGVDEIKLIRETVESLHKKYKINIRVRGCIIEIIAEGIPRTLQFIFTNENDANAIISKFDSAHLMMHYDGKTLIMHKMCEEALTTQVSNWRKYATQNLNKRLYKHLNRGYKIGINYELLVPDSSLFLYKKLDYEYLKNYKVNDVNTDVDGESRFKTISIILNKKGNKIIKPKKKILQKQLYHFFWNNSYYTDLCNDLLADLSNEPYHTPYDITHGKSNSVDKENCKNIIMNINQIFKYVIQSSTIEKFPSYENEYYGIYEDNESIMHETTIDETNKDIIPSFENKSKLINIKKYVDNSSEFAEKKVKCSDIYRIFDLDTYEHNIVITNCLCIDIYQKSTSGYYVATLKLEKNTKAYRYIKFLANKWSKGHIYNENYNTYSSYESKLLHAEHVIKQTFNSGDIDENDNFKLHMPNNMITEKDKTYPILLIKPRIFLKNGIATMYWIRKDRFDIVKSIMYGLDCDTINLMDKIRTPRMEKIRMRLRKLMNNVSNIYDPEADISKQYNIISQMKKVNTDDMNNIITDLQITIFSLKQDNEYFENKKIFNLKQDYRKHKKNFKK
jgi:hypothetical protein